ncbi:MAG: TM2 domain-containing protein [Bacteroidales bacterium]|nr:TM2 domain-containing protein [Bacteroidales bacterium]
MKQELIQTFLLNKGEYFDPVFLPEIQHQLEAIDDSKAGYVLGVGVQNPTIILVIAILLGWERFFLDDIALGVVKILTCYGLGIWWLVDIFTAVKRTRDYNYRKLSQAIMLSK